MAEKTDNLSEKLAEAITTVFGGDLVGDLDARAKFVKNFGEFVDQLNLIRQESDRQVKDEIEKLPTDERPENVAALFFRMPRGWAEKAVKVTGAPTISLNL